MKKAIFIIFLLSIASAVHAKDAYQGKALQELRVMEIKNVAAVVEAGGEVIPCDSEKESIFCCTGHVAVPVGQSGFANGINVPAAGGNGITIASPADGATFTGSKVIIKGTIDTTTQTVNSVLVKVTTSTNMDDTSYLAQVNGKYFAAEIQLAPGVVSTVTAKVTYQGGGHNETSIIVTGGSQQEMVKLTASPNVGVPTLKLNGQATLDVFLNTVLSIHGPIVSFAWDFNGDGTIDLTCPTLAGVTASFPQPGLYLPKVTVTDTAGNTYTATVIVNVLDTAQMNDLFKGIWNGMKNSLITGKISDALNYLLPDSRQKFSAAFDALQQNTISQIALGMQDIEQVSVSDTVTKYRIKRNQVIDGQNQTITYYIYYVRDQDGQWKLEDF